MINLTISNTYGAAIGLGTDIALPRPFEWLAIAAAGNKTVPCERSTLNNKAPTGISPAEALDAMVRAGTITVTVAEIATGSDVETLATRDGLGFGLGRDASGNLEYTGVNPTSGDGLETTLGVTSVNPGTGIMFDGSNPKKTMVDSTDGLTLSGNHLVVNAGNGLEFDGSNPKKVQVKVVAASGVTAAAGGISVDGHVEGTSVATTDAVQTTVATLALGGVAGVKAFKLLVKCSYDDNSGGGAYLIVGAAKTDGATGTILGTPSVTSVEGDAALACTVDCNAGNLRVRATGIGATNMHWQVFGEMR